MISGVKIFIRAEKDGDTESKENEVLISPIAQKIFFALSCKFFPDDMPAFAVRKASNAVLVDDKQLWKVMRRLMGQRFDDKHNVILFEYLCKKYKK